MHHANWFYGHAHILAKYVGIKGRPPTINGYLQHGWNTHDGFAAGTKFAPGYPLFVWSESVVRRGWHTGLRGYEVVGAPFAYLLQLEKQQEWEARNPHREGTIVYPFHGWEGQHVLGAHDEYIAEIRRTEGDVPITVCLYINEYRDPEVRAEYQNAGFRVICHGERGYNYRGGNPRFLWGQLAELRRHERVVSNRLTSAIFYGAATGARVGVYGNPMLLEAERAQLGGPTKPVRNWPEMHHPFVDPDHARTTADVELGIDHLLPPEELRRVFGW